MKSDYFVLDVNYRGGHAEGLPMIYRAISKLPVLKLLESKGARVFGKVESSSLSNLTPLMVACLGQYDRSETIHYLCENYKEMINYFNEKDGRTALMMSATRREIFEDTEYHAGHNNNLVALLTYEPDLKNVRSDNNCSAVELALLHDVYPLYYWLTEKERIFPDFKKVDAKIRKYFFLSETLSSFFL